MSTAPLNQPRLARWRAPTGDTVASMYCLPHAGAGAGSLTPFATLAPAQWDCVGVRLPGREIRLAEEPPTDIAQAVADVRQAILTDPLRPPGAGILLLGQCSGCVLAFEVARGLIGVAAVRALVVVSRAAPSVSVAVPDPDQPDGPFLDRLAQVGAIAPELRAIPEAVELILPALRADVRTVAGYRRGVEDRVPVPILAVHGRTDVHCRAEEMAPWREFGTGDSGLTQVPGGHLLLAESPASVMAAVDDSGVLR